MIYEPLQRAVACLQGLAVGDALGKMTEGYWPDQIIATYGGPVSDFRQPVQPSSKHSWGRAEVTDDTRLAILLAESIVARGYVDRHDYTRRLLARPIKGWPGWEELSARDDPDRRGYRTGNAAPARIAPVGVIHRPGDLDVLVDSVEQACIMTHHVASAISAAAAVAAAVSAAVEGWAKDQVLSYAQEAARLGKSRGRRDRAGDVGKSIEIGCHKLRGDCSGLGWKLRGLTPGFDAWEGASFALTLVAGTDSAQEAILEATNQGGDADSVAAMAGCILAALHPASLPTEWAATVEQVNGLRLADMAEDLIALRKGGQ